MTLFGLFGPPNVDRLKAKANINGLINALDDSRVREQAVRALVEIGPRAVDPLLVTLRNESHLIRQAATRALGQIGDKRAVEHLISAINEGRAPMFETIEALEKLKAIDPLIALLRDDYVGTRGAAAKALGRSADPRAALPLASAVKDKEKWARSVKAARANQWKLAERLQEDEKRMRSWAVDALRNLGEIAISELLSALTSDDVDSRRSAVEALGDLGDRRAVEPLIAVLRSESWDIRVSACEALARLGDPRAVNALIAAHRDQHRHWVQGPDGEEYETCPVEHAAARALEQIGETEAQRALADFRQRR